MAGIVPEPWLDWGLGTEEDKDPRPAEADILATYDAVTTDSRKAQHKLGKLVNQSHHAAHTAYLDQLPETARPPGPDDRLGGRETKAFTKTRHRTLQGTGATACLRARPTDSLRVLSTAEFVGLGRRLVRIEEPIQ